MRTAVITLCEGRRCRSRGTHASGCAGEPECLGCEPRLAADGLRLCWSHREAIARHALLAVEIYEELTLQLAASSSPAGDYVTSTTMDKGIKLNSAAVEARDRIMSVLSAWSSMIAEQRGFRWPTIEARPMAAFVADSASWLAAHPAAADCLDELHELAWGWPRAIAYPSGNRTIKLGACPHCEGSVAAVLRRPDSLVPSEVRCDLDEAHRWRGPAAWAELAELMRSDRSPDSGSP
jgi:hypothetical protein